MGRAGRAIPAGYTLITGGCGFIGTNLAERILSQGGLVMVLDNLSRPGVKQNLKWLRERHGRRLLVALADIRETKAVRQAVRGAAEVFHLAAQVAVTTSLVDPVDDFEVNARGTLNVLEAIRGRESPPPLVFTSTNKVYGGLPDLSLRAGSSRYEPEGRGRAAVGEDRPLEFCSPYGCSKGAADQYVLDYARTFSLPAAVFRMSCIYGPHQLGTEDQGWVAHLLLRALEGEPITIYGDGKQVRDVLYADDLVSALLLAARHIDRVQARAFNIGGGPANTLSLLELLELIGQMRGGRPPVHFGEWRPADQRYYVSDFRKFARATGWSPKVAAREGVHRLFEWLRANRAPRPAKVPVEQNVLN